MRTSLSLVLTAALLSPAVASAQPSSGGPVHTVTVAGAPSLAIAPTVPQPDAYTPNSPEYTEVRDSYNAPMFTSGALVFAASYGGSVLVATNDGSRGNRNLYVPIVGPWLALNERGSCDATKMACDHELTAKLLLIADGVFQAIGVLGIIDGAVKPTSHREVIHTASRLPKVHVSPTFTNGNPGLAALGKF